ncbi:MAG: hypothetical protein ACMG6S_22125 [Byssovorax sp.]
MINPTEDPADASVDLALDLDEEQLAQIDALIEEHATPSRRLTREEMLQLLVERGCDLVAQGESLLPYVESPPAADDTTKH